MRSKQSWQTGSLVSVGFIRNLRVVAKIPTPGDYAPDMYALHAENTDRWYRFVPHHGIERVETLAQACAL